jgi:hypothetical protein
MDYYRGLLWRSLFAGNASADALHGKGFGFLLHVSPGKVRDKIQRLEYPLIRHFEVHPRSFLPGNENTGLEENFQVTGEIRLLKLQRRRNFTVAPYSLTQLLKDPDTVGMCQREKDFRLKICSGLLHGVNPFF